MSQNRGEPDPVLAEILHPIYERDGEAYLQDVYSFVSEDMGRNNPEIWAGLDSLSAAGIIRSYDRGGRTVLEIGRDNWDAGDVPSQKSSYTRGEEWTQMNREQDWFEVEGMKIPRFDSRILEDFFERHPEYDEDSYSAWSTDRFDVTRGYTTTDSGEKEYWTAVANDRKEEKDVLTLTMKFNNEPEVFQPRHRQSYAEKLWEPLRVLQQRNSMLNEAVEDAVEDILSRQGANSEDWFLSRLASLGRERGDYEEVRDAVVSNYSGDLSINRVLMPFSRKFELDHRDVELLESGMDRKEVVGNKLPVYGEGKDKNRINVEVYLDGVYKTLKAQS